MNNRNQIIIIVSLCITLVACLYLIYRIANPFGESPTPVKLATSATAPVTTAANQGVTNSPAQNQSAAVLPGAIINLVAIDMDDDGKLSLDELRQGRDGVIGILSKDIAVANTQGTETGQLLLFNNVGSLLQFETSGDDMLSRMDPIFSKLLFINATPNEQVIVYRSLEKSGVSAVIFNASFIRMEQSHDSSRFKIPAGHAVMSDSSHRMIKIIPIDQNRFLNATIVPADIEH